MQKLLFILFMLTATVIFWACNDVDVDPNDTEAKFEIRLTDAAGDYDQVNIDLLQVRVKMKADSNFQDVFTYAGIYDLLTLQNGLDTLIVRANLPLGEVQQIRLVLGPNSNIMVDSIIHELKTPSAEQSGLKINVNKLMVRDSLNKVLLDFDADKSIVEKGNGTYSLKPVLRVIK